MLFESMSRCHYEHFVPVSITGQLFFVMILFLFFNIFFVLYRSDEIRAFHLNVWLAMKPFRIVNEMTITRMNMFQSHDFFFINELI